VCKRELGELAKSIPAGKLDSRVVIINAVTETTTRKEKATPKFVWEFAAKYKANFPQAVDAAKSLFKFAGGGGSIGLPFHVAVDLRTMKLVYAKSGLQTVDQINAQAKKILGSQ